MEAGKPVEMWLRGIKLFDLMTSGGAAILLIAWLVQQTYLQDTNDKLTKLNSAKATAAVMDSSRLVLQAIACINGADKNHITSLTSDLEQHESLLFTDLQTRHIIHLESEINPTSSLASLAKLLAKEGFPARASVTYEKIDVEEANIRSAANKAWWVFIAIYLVGGLITLCGSVLKALQGEIHKS